jgi:peptidoglycan/LPS O-acetylase OafA/YrhL
MTEAIARVYQERAAGADSVARTASPPASSAYIPTLDGWRAVAVALVLASHAVGPISPWRDACGGLGVSIFFGISGYLICGRLLEERRRSGRIRLGAFYVRRAFRILPPALVLLTVVALAGAFHVIRVSALELGASTFFFRNYVPGHWYTSHFWSLAVEEHFYLFFPALLVFAGSRRTTWIALAISGATAVWRVVDTHFGVLTGRFPGVYAGERTDFRLDGLLLGCFAALVLYRTALRVPRHVALVVAPACMALLAASTLHILPLPEVFKAAAIVAMLVSTAFTPDGALGRFLERAPVRWVGRLSYSLYLWQQVFFVKYPSNRIPWLGPLQSMPLSLAMVFALACLSYYVVERPMVKVGHRLARSPVPART